MPAVSPKVKIFQGFGIETLTKEINQFLSQFAVTEVKAVSITVDDKVIFVVIAYVD